MLTVSAINPSAMKAYANAGFAVEGVMRQACYRDGQYHDKIMMAILRSEWDEQNSLVQ